MSATIAALLGGILPAVLWLFFWLREDRLHPEPKRLIFLSFVLGMAAVAVVLPFEQLSLRLLSGTGFVILSWALIEEVFKYVAAYLGGLRTKALDEPIDAPIYLVTAALGFAAFENVLFLLAPLVGGDALLGLVTGNIRFIGSTLLHTISSGAIGVAIALSFYKPKAVKLAYLSAGFVLAVLLHTLFNYFILERSNESVLIVFSFVWLAVILLILFLEKIKRIRKSTISHDHGNQ